MIRHYFSTQFVRFLCVGGTAALLHWLARYLLSAWIAFPAAVAMAYVVGIAAAFELNRRIVFPASERPISKQARDFILINLLFFPVVWLAAMFFRHILKQVGVNHFVDGIAHGMAIALPVLMTFLMYKFIAFGSK